MGIMRESLQSFLGFRVFRDYFGVLGALYRGHVDGDSSSEKRSDCGRIDLCLLLWDSRTCM